MGLRNVMFLIIVTGCLAMAFAANAADVDKLLRLEEYCRGITAADWPEPGTVFAYA